MAGPLILRLKYGGLAGIIHGGIVKKSQHGDAEAARLANIGHGVTAIAGLGGGAGGGLRLQLTAPIAVFRRRAQAGGCARAHSASLFAPNGIFAMQRKRAIAIAEQRRALFGRAALAAGLLLLPALLLLLIGP